MPVSKSAGPKGRKAPVAAVSLAGLAADKEASSKKFGKAPATTEKYGQRQQQGFKWLNDLMAAEARTQQPLGCPSQGSLQDASTMFSLDVLAHAFDKIPTQASPWVLALFIASKCFGDNACGPATAWQIYSAFKMMWHHADPNGKYQGRWRWDEERHCGHGNPAQSTEVDDIITAVKNRDGAEGTRFHSCAMKLEYMDRIMEWSSTQCPPTILRELGRLHGEDKWLDYLDELQYKHIIEDAWTDDRYRFRHLVVTLEHRKGWQNKLSKEIDLQGHRYKIHSQREMPSVDMEYHLREWLVFLRAFVYGRDLEDSDYIFPSWLDEFVTGAGIKLGRGRLTTHCFRRGGAQYHFMHAPVGKRWSLATIRWWGGWAKGKHCDTLIRYLLDELYYYEDGHGDALWPISTEADKSFLGEHTEIRPATKQEIQAIISTQLENVTARIVEAYHSHPRFGLTTFGAPSRPRCGEHNPTAGPAPCAMEPTSLMLIPTSQTSTDPPRDLRIPPLPKTGPMNARWKQADWHPTWYSGANQEAFGVQYGKRKLIALEFLDSCKGDEAEFLRKWPVADSGGPTKLLKAIHRA
ncbi:hypothetical protein JB92DRAFT_3105217 [Gautieria morchelliformis]|nr:hypothetical protein JB92DRAFT_3105217 [Gautieria morchelliformis]